ncbi:MAG TPA: MBL fold metallo-hydrolase [Candidatus Onthovicinus excrementipullorum]|nr:MBL fold metallo-hydrolase [Candidatus Onthovicinus excrementipullorum]
MKRKRLSAKKRRAIRRAVAGLIAAAAVAFSGIITFGDELGLNTPNWEQIKASVGAQDQANLTALPVNVFYIDVGQGDCELIHTPSGNILIDAGESLPENAAKIISFAKQLEIEKFDCVIATHPHSDHIGSMADVLEKIPADQIIMPELPEEETPTTRVYENLLDTITRLEIPVLSAVPGEQYEIAGVTLEILAPLEEDENLNNMSVVVKMRYQDASFLFDGDAESGAERAMLASGEDLRADILKVGHHGSRTSSTKDYLEAVQPEIAVISCGEGNSYGHPHQQTLDKFNALGIRSFRTDVNGTITIGTDGNTYEVITEHGSE